MNKDNKNLGLVVLKLTKKQRNHVLNILTIDSEKNVPHAGMLPFISITEARIALISSYIWDSGEGQLYNELYENDDKYSRHYPLGRPRKVLRKTGG